MVGMVMGDKNSGQRPTFPVEQSQHRPGIARVDDNRLRPLTEKPDVVVFERRNANDLEHRWNCERIGRNVNSRS